MHSHLLSGYLTENSNENIDAVYFNTTSRQKLLARRLGSDRGAGRDVWAVPVEMPLCHSPKSNQLSGR